MKRGKLYLFISATIYGIAPLFAKLAVESGGDGVTLVFIRSLLALPPLFLIISSKGIGFHLNKKLAGRVFVAAALLNAPTYVLLYSAYSGGDASRATLLHFVYPMLIVIYSALFLKRRTSFLKWLGVGVALSGLGFYTHFRIGSVYDLLALLSGFLYAGFVLYLDVSGLDRMHYFRLTFYLALAKAIATFIACIAGGGFSLPSSVSGWVSAAIITLLVNICAIPLFQVGVRKAGAEAAGIISFTEPLVTALLGATVLGESLSMRGIISLAIMLFGIVLIEKGQAKTE